MRIESESDRRPYPPGRRDPGRGAMHHDGGRSYLQGCLLLLIAEHPDHGYDLAARLAPFGLADADAATTYRALRALEREGSISSTWAPSAGGPARRIYRLTGSGFESLAEFSVQLRRSQVEAARYLHRWDEMSERLRQPAQNRHTPGALHG